VPSQIATGGRSLKYDGRYFPLGIVFFYEISWILIHFISKHTLAFMLTQKDMRPTKDKHETTFS